VLDKEGISGMEESDSYLLAGLADHPNISVAHLSSLPRQGDGHVLAEVVLGDKAIRWAVSDASALVADPRWGDSHPLIIAAGLEPLHDRVELLGSGEIRPRPLDQGDREISIHHELDGPLQGFGKRFWALVTEEYPATAILFSDERLELCSVTYRDRYLFTPLSVALLINLIKGLRDRLGQHCWKNPLISVTTTQELTPGNRRSSGKVWSDWRDLSQRDAAIVNGFDFLEMTAKAIPMPKRQTMHGRILELGFSSGTRLYVRLDQGISYWRAMHLRHSRRANIGFNFFADEISQAEAIAEMAVEIEGADHATQLFLKTRAAEK